MTQRINVTNCQTSLNRIVRHHDFDLASTLECGQAFRWHRQADGWYEGVVGKQVWRIRQTGNILEGNFDPGYLALEANLPAIIATFPKDKPLQQAVKKHWGLRLTRQEPWETLASFIASSTKQIVQIRQIVEHLARRFGTPLSPTHFTFPAPDVIARAKHEELLACKLGFRAKYLLAAARVVDSGKLDLTGLRKMEYGRALEELMKLPGVGEKIGNCVLLFSCGHENAFPIDVWVRRALERLYRHPVTPEHFGPYAGWANQYLFHAERTQ